MNKNSSILSSGLGTELSLKETSENQGDRKKESGGMLFQRARALTGEAQFHRLIRLHLIDAFTVSKYSKETDAIGNMLSPQITRTYVIKGKIGNKKHLELYPQVTVQQW